MWDHHPNLAGNRKFLIVDVSPCHIRTYDDGAGRVDVSPCYIRVYVNKTKVDVVYRKSNTIPVNPGLSLRVYRQRTKNNTQTRKKMFKVKQKITTICKQELFLVRQQSTGQYIICSQVCMASDTEASSICNPRHKGSYNYIMKKWKEFTGKLEFIR